MSRLTGDGTKGSTEWNGQLLQDRWIVEVVYPDIKEGFFVELGASNGVSLSNTLVLEKRFNWSGILIEPCVSVLALPFNRDNVIDNALCWNEDGCQMEFITSQHSILGIDKLHHLSGIAHKIDRWAPVGLKESIVTQTLSSVLRRHNAPNFIEYLSLDTEGSEFEVLQGVDWARYIFGAITVEHNFVERKRKNVSDLLSDVGYSLYSEVLFEDWFVHSSISIQFDPYPSWLPRTERDVRG